MIGKLAKLSTGILVILVLSFLITVPLYGQKKKSSKPEAFTFLFWTDQEIDQNKKGAYSGCQANIDAMNSIAGQAYPQSIGGKVAKPDFIGGGGDITGWPTTACVKSWDKICNQILKYPTRTVAGNHDSGGGSPSQKLYDWMRNDPFIKAHASDNGIKAWTPNKEGSGIIPGIQYSFEHKGIVFILPTPTYDGSGKSPAGSSPIYQPDIDWLKAELAKYDPKQPKIVINHFNAGSIMNRKVIDDIYAKNNVLFHFCGHWEKITHWHFGITDWVMDNGNRPKAKNGSFSAVHVDRDKITVAHYLGEQKKWADKIIIRKIPKRW